jgi:hypothetical protein
MAPTDDDYQIYKAPVNDINEGHIWVHDPCLNVKLQGQRRIVRIQRADSDRKRVYCEALYADDRDLRHWNVPLGCRVILMNEWYRQRLGITDPTPPPSPMSDEGTATRSEPESSTARSPIPPPTGRESSLWWRLWACLQERLGGPDAPNATRSPRKLVRTLRLNIEFSECLLTSMRWQLLACLQHPQIVVLVASVLGVLGVGFALVALGLSFPTVAKDLRDFVENVFKVKVKEIPWLYAHRYHVVGVLWLLFVPAGFAVIFWGMLAVRRRARP